VAAPQNRVRINAGIWRSRLLTFPDGPGLRPTPDRVRQTVFNWLGQDMHGLACLDLFSGTGAMGFEALSRGARQALMIEKSPIAYKALLHNKAALGATDADIRQMDAMQFLSQNVQRFDVIFLDPPYHQDWIPRLLNQAGAHLAEHGQVYVEAEYALTDSDHWHIARQGKAGNVFYHLLEFKN
jgi:16S rRNA (guanine(966)-N(2))-methyltransferase RsmD